MQIMVSALYMRSACKLSYFVLDEICMQNCMCFLVLHEIRMLLVLVIVIVIVVVIVIVMVIVIVIVMVIVIVVVIVVVVGSR